MRQFDQALVCVPLAHLTGLQRVLAAKALVSCAICSTVCRDLPLLGLLDLDGRNAWHDGHRHAGRHPGSKAVTVALSVVQAIASLLGERQGHCSRLTEGLNGAFEHHVDLNVGGSNLGAGNRAKVQLLHTDEVTVGPFLRHDV